MPPSLLKYWLPGGVGGAKIMWGKDGDYDRCIVNIGEETAKHGHPLESRRLHGLCNTLHELATGHAPGHAPGESKPGSKH